MKINIKKAAAAALLVLFAASGCSGTGNEGVGRRTFALGTVCEQKIYDGSESAAADLLKEGENEINRMDALISTSRDSSEINKSAQAAGDSVECDESVVELVARAKQLSEQTEGAFEPTLGALIAAWDFNGTPRVPSEEEIKTLLKTVDSSKIKIDEDADTIAVEKGQQIDLGGIAKGYIADVLTELYRKNGVERALINLGGNIRAIGEFTLGIRDPQGESDDYVCTITLKDSSIVTSGAYIRNFEQDGVVYHHILDPKTGKPAESDLLSVSIVCTESAVADAYSTAVYVLGEKEGLALVERTEGAECLLVTEDNRVVMSSGFKAQCAPQFADGTSYTWE